MRRLVTLCVVFVAAAIVRGDKLNDQDYDRDLRVHEMLLQIEKGSDPSI